MAAVGFTRIASQQSGLPDKSVVYNHDTCTCISLPLMNTRAFISILACVCMHTQNHTHTHIHTQNHTHTHTHKTHSYVHAHTSWDKCIYYLTNPSVIDCLTFTAALMTFLLWLFSTYIVTNFNYYVT